MNDKILVSVITLAFNHEKYIRQCLDGIVFQKTNFLFELLIHDDASTDNTANIIREYQAKYPQILKPIFQKENQYSKGGNLGARFIYPKAKGKYLALCEGDDYWTDPNKLQRQVDFLESHPNYSLCVHKAICFNDRKQAFESCFPKIHEEIDFTVKDIISGGGGFFSTNSMLYRADCQSFESIWSLCPVGDYPLAIKLALKGKVRYFPEIMSCYRTFAKGSWSVRTLCGKDAKEKRSKFIKAMDVFLNALDKFTHDKYTKEIKNKIDLNHFKLYWDFKMWNKLKKTTHYKQRTFIGKIKAFIHCLI